MSKTLYSSTPHKAHKCRDGAFIVDKRYPEIIWMNFFTGPISIKMDWATLDASVFLKCLFFLDSFCIQRRPHKQWHKLYKSCDTWDEGTHIHLQMIMIILHLTGWYFEFRTDESRPVPGVEFGSQSISDRPADSRGDRRRSGRECNPRRSLHASLLVTLPSWTRGRRECIDEGRQGKLEGRMERRKRELLSETINCLCFVAFLLISSHSSVEGSELVSSIWRHIFSVIYYHVRAFCLFLWVCGFPCVYVRRMSCMHVCGRVFYLMRL